MNHPKHGRAVGAAVVLLLLLIVCPAVWGDVYKWVDAKGVVHFSDQPPARQDEPLEVEISPSAPPSTYQPPPRQEKPEAKAQPEEKEADTPAAPKESPPAQVELYVTSWCKYCKIAKNYLTTHHIAFNEYDIEKDRQAAQRRKEIDPRPGVPLAVINGKTIIGFSEKRYAWALSQTP